MRAGELVSTEREKGRERERKKKKKKGEKMNTLSKSRRGEPVPMRAFSTSRTFWLARCGAVCVRANRHTRAGRN